MRITSCQIKAFGLFQNRSFRNLDHSAVVMLGANEAGKSTFFHFLKAMLYGIYPADVEKHPYASRDGKKLEGQLQYRLDDGQERTVTRGLLSAPRGQLDDGEGGRLRNHAVPAVRHVSREVFESVYALQLQDLARLEGGAWEEVQDRLLGGRDMNFVRSAREVAIELEGEASALWQPRRRGTSKAQNLQKRRQVLRAEARATRKNDEALRALHAEAARCEKQIEALREEQTTLRAHRHRAERLAPVRNLLRRITSLRERAGDLAPYDTVPDSPRKGLRELTREVASLETELGDKRRRLEAAEQETDALSGADRKLLDHDEEILTWSKKAEAYQRRAAEVEDTKLHRSQARERLEEAAERLLAEPWYSELGDVLRGISQAELRDRVKQCQVAADRLEEMRSQAETLALHAEARKRLLPWLAVMGGGAGVIGADLTGRLPLEGGWAFGGVLLLFGVLQTYAAWNHNRRLSRQRESLDLEGLRAEVEERAALVEELLAGLPIPPERLRRPDRDFLEDMHELKAALKEYDAHTAHLQQQAGDVLEARKQVGALSASCGQEVEDEETLAANVARLETCYEAARDHQKKAEKAKARVAQLRPAVRELSSTLESRRKQLQEAKAQLRELGEGDVEAGAKRLTERREARRRAALAEDTLHTDYPDWEARRADIEAIEEGEEGWSYSDEERACIEQRLEELTDSLREKDKAQRTKRAKIEQLQDKRSPSEVESEIAVLDARLEEIERRRDRLMLLAALVKKADYLFRMKHQPDVIRRASGHLQRIAEGRYERLLLEEETNRLLIQERGRSLAEPVAPPLSQGTLDQVYLAVRLAILDHLDAGQERLPLFLDEIFVNWDTRRRREALNVLQDMMTYRQVFLFTCHPYFAREAADFLDAHYIKLGES